MAKRVEELVAQRVEEELEKRKDEIEQEVLRRVEDAKRVMEKQMLEEMERQRQVEMEAQKKKEVKNDTEATEPRAVMACLASSGMIVGVVVVLVSSLFTYSVQFTNKENMHITYTLSDLKEKFKNFLHFELCYSFGCISPIITHTGRA